MRGQSTLGDMGLEVERKFLLSEPPPGLDSCPATPIEQGYLALSDGVEVRLRRAGESRTLTVKRGAGEVREEVEVALDPTAFERLWPLTESRRLSKIRYRKPLGEGVEAEVDVYRGRLEGLIVAEVEFPSSERSRGFQPPPWLAQEVTGDERYANRNLALNGDGAVATSGSRQREDMSSSGGPSRSYRLKRKEGAAEGLRRIAAGRARKAVEALRGEGDEDPAEAIHSARKDLKKLRAVLRLSRKELGGDTYGAENRRYRDAGRMLSRSRDAEVKLETLGALRERFGSALPESTREAWARALERERDEIAGADSLGSPQVAAAAEAIEAGGDAVAEWPLEEESWDAIGPGLARSYRRGRQGLKRTIAEASAENVHEWRKRAKDLTYQLRIVRGAWPELLGETVEESHRLTDLLGEHHDLALLAEDLGQRRLGDRAEVADLIEHRQRELLAEALELGRRVYAEKPKAFERRIRSYWRAWRGGAA